MYKKMMCFQDDSFLFFANHTIDNIISTLGFAELLNAIAKYLIDTIFVQSASNITFKGLLRDLQAYVPRSILHARLFWFSELAPWFDDTALTVENALDGSTESVSLLYFLMRTTSSCSSEKSSLSLCWSTEELHC